MLGLAVFLLDYADIGRFHKLAVPRKNYSHFYKKN